MTMTIYPRPLDASERDEMVLDLLKNHDYTTREIANELRLPENLVYISLRRLSKAGKARRMQQGTRHCNIWCHNDDDS